MTLRVLTRELGASIAWWLPNCKCPYCLSENRTLGRPYRELWKCAWELLPDGGSAAPRQFGARACHVGGGGQGRLPS
ncbi:MAG: hypothetical protein ACYDCB_09730, partial [Candidatus Dormibacteria bacterium]